MLNEILIRNGYLNAPKSTGGNTLYATMINNMSYYGYVPNQSLIHILSMMSSSDIVSLWSDVEPALKKITADDKNMDDFVVYKNFPNEVLNMADGEWMIRQILIYLGIDKEILTEEEKSRPSLFENRKLKVLSPSDDNTIPNINKSLISKKSKWSDNEKEWAKFLYNKLPIIIDEYGFKENAVYLISNNWPCSFDTNTATDVLRVAAGLSDGDISLRTPCKLRNFKRAERKQLLRMLDRCKNLVDDFGQRPEQWKRLLSRLHPGDYSYDNVKMAYNTLYNRNYVTYNSRINPKEVTDDIIKALSERPGEFMRKLHYAYSLFGRKALSAFIAVASDLSFYQLIKIKKYIDTINIRNTLYVAPRGNWSKSQILPNNKVKFTYDDFLYIQSGIANIIQHKGKDIFPNGVDGSLDLHKIKLPTNDQELAEYGRGTVFDIPDDVTFIRSASFWKADKRLGVTWYDNGWNFMNEDWKEIDSCTWSNQQSKNKSAIYSGDPVNIKQLDGKACQIADLYIDKLIENGVRYAVWSIMCYSRIPYEQSEVLATLQMGVNAEKGKLYEPSRAQMIFPLKGSSLTKYVAYIDLHTRRIVYMDANLPGKVASASFNGALLSKQMPAYVEYLESLPSMKDVVDYLPNGHAKFLYTDKDVSLHDEKAYVFIKENPNNSFDPIAIEDIIG